MQQDYEWDDGKRISNLKKHGVDFRDVAIFEWGQAVVSEDISESYGEPRYKALGFVSSCLMLLVFTLRGETVRVISLRKATRQEVRSYGS
jgi:hypothetical protein